MSTAASGHLLMMGLGRPHRPRDAVDNLAMFSGRSCRALPSLAVGCAS